MRRLIIAALLLSAGCADTPGEWSAFVYPDRRDHSDYRKTDGFRSLDYCRSQAVEQMKAIQVSAGGDYLCGHKCGPPREPGGPELCAETRK